MWLCGTNMSEDDNNLKPKKQPKAPLTKYSGGAGFPISMPMNEKEWFLRRFESKNREMIYKQCKTRHEAYRRRALKQAADYCFNYGGKPKNRYDMMEHIVMLSFEGWELPQILNDMSHPDNEMPVPQEVHRWMELHKDFKDNLELARRYKGEVYNSMAIQAVMTAGDGRPDGPTRDQVGYAKLIHDTLREQAAISNDKMQKTIKQQVEDVTKRDLTPDQIDQRIKALVADDPSLKSMIEGNVLSTISDSEVFEEAEMEDE